MSKEAEDFIKRAERETGMRCDDPRGNAMTFLIGALAREMGESSQSTFRISLVKEAPRFSGGDELAPRATGKQTTHID